jgi:predicted transcriptional regulator
MKGKPVKLTKTIGLFLAANDGLMPVSKQAEELGLTVATVFKFRKIIREATRGEQCFRKFYPARKVRQPSPSEINQWFK